MLTVDGLAGALRRVLPATSRDRKAPVALRCVLLESTGAALRLVATDRHRLAISEAAITAGEESVRVLVPGHELEAVADGTVELDVVGDTLEIRSAHMVCAVPIVHDEFPNIDAVLAALGTASTVVVEGPTLLDAIERAASGAPLRIHLTAGSLQLGESPAIGLDVTYDGADIFVFLNADYAHDAVAVVAAGNVAIDVVDEMTPVAFRAVGEPGQLTLVMPMRVATPRRSRMRR